MKAILNTKYGTPETLILADIEKPALRKSEVLVRIIASSVNSWDWDFLIGKPLIYRLIFGLFKPKINILGCDIAGIVETVGDKVVRFKPGDRVFGDNSSANWGGFSEYVSIPEKNLEFVPSGMGFEEAAAIPQAGILAYQGMIRGKLIQKGDQVLIIGAAGGVGTFALQMAKNKGAYVTVVDRGDKLDFLKKLGADYRIDYLKEDFSRQDTKFDLILDVVARKAISDYKRVLKPDGHLYVVGGSVNRLLQIALFGKLIASKNQKIKLVVHRPNQGLKELIRLYENGDLKPIIDKIYCLQKVPEALHYLGEAKVKGKLVIRVSESQP